MQTLLRSGLATAVGSLPHTDPRAAARLVLDRHPELPAAPQLPRRTGREMMLAQWLEDLDGIHVNAAGHLLGADAESVDLDAADHVVLDHERHGGLLGFLAEARGHVDAVKVQVTGPYTLGTALVHAGLPEALAYEVAARRSRAAVRAVLDRVGEDLGSVAVVLGVDEPSLADVVRRYSPLGPETVMDLVSGTLAATGPDVTTVLHCCAPCDLRIAIGAGPDVLNVPATEGMLAGAGAFTSFLEHGGWVAWGAVPTHAPLGSSEARHWRRLRSLSRALGEAGADLGVVASRAVVTPECGLARFDEDQAARVLDLTRRLGDRIAEYS